MKNIIWSTGAGVAITMLAEDADSAQHAADMIARGVADASWAPVAFDVAVSSEHMADVGGLRWADGALAIDPAALAARRWAAHQAQAQAALDASDITMIRCIEHGVMVPAEWVSYRGALRAIVRASSGDPDQTLPSRPAYPSGT